MAQSASLFVSRLPLTLCSMLLGLPGSLLLPQSALAQTDDNTKAGGGIVWYAGTVLSSAAEAERIDLGDVHGILEGDLLAAFRRTDNHYRPLGTVQIIESHPTWSRPGGPVAAQLQQGDLVLGIRTVRQIGTGSDFSEAFLNRQLIRNSNRNGYSTLREQESAQVLRTIVNRQQALGQTTETRRRADPWCLCHPRGLPVPPATAQPDPTLPGFQRPSAFRWKNVPHRNGPPSPPC